MKRHASIYLVYDGKLRRCAEENRTEFNCTSCARPQGESQGGFAATRGGFARGLCPPAGRVADTRTRVFAARGFAATRGGFAATHGRGHKIACTYLPRLIYRYIIIIIRHLSYQKKSLQSNSLMQVQKTQMQ